jgi:sodium transport system permease protein
VVLYSVLLPLLLYPFLLWLMVTAMTFIEGQQEKRTYRVAYHSDLDSGEFAKFIHWLDTQERLSLIPVSPTTDELGTYHALLKTESKDGEVHLKLNFVGNRPESTEANDFLTERLSDFNLKQRQAWLEENQLSAEAGKPYLLKGTSTAASGDVGGYLLGALLPIGLLVMIALGGAYPAIDTTAGERERGTWETLQSCGPSLTKIIVSKYLFVSIVCCLSGTLNLFAMLVSIRSIVAPLLRENDSITFSVGPATMLVLLLGVIGVSFFVAAALLVCSIFARTFREGQALTTPMFMMIALPVLPLSDPSLQLNSTLAFVPLVNLALVWRQALQGQYEVVYILQTLLTLGGLIAVALWFGAGLLRNETLMTGQGPEMSWSNFFGVVKGVFRGK